MDDTTYDTLTDDEIRDELTTWAGREAAATAHVVLLIGELDNRGAWQGTGLLSAAHWCSWKLGLGLQAARERVRVAKALRDLPRTTQEFLAGRLSWSQVRALTRFTTITTEHDHVVMARHATGAHLEKIARGVRRSYPPSDPDLAAWRRTPRVRHEDDGDVTISFRIPAQHSTVVLAALEQTRSELAAAAGEEGDTAVSLGDALVHLGTQKLQATAPSRRTPAVHRALTVHLDPVSGWTRLADGEHLPPGTVELPDDLADARLRRATKKDRRRHDQGRRERLVTAALRDLLGAVDGEQCRIPGCTRRHRLAAHHVKWWRNGGRTDLANLLLLCEHHHTLIHDGMLTVSLDKDRTLHVTDRWGLPLTGAELPPPRTDVDPGGRISAGTLPPGWGGERLDLAHAVWVVRHQTSGAAA